MTHARGRWAPNEPSEDRPRADGPQHTPGTKTTTRTWPGSHLATICGAGQGARTMPLSATQEQTGNATVMCNRMTPPRLRIDDETSARNRRSVGPHGRFEADGTNPCHRNRWPRALPPARPRTYGTTRVVVNDYSHWQRPAIRGLKHPQPSRPTFRGLRRSLVDHVNGTRN